MRRNLLTAIFVSIFASLLSSSAFADEACRERARIDFEEALDACDRGSDNTNCNYFYQINQTVCGINCQYFYQTNEVRCQDSVDEPCTYYYQINQVVCGRDCQYFYQTNQVACVRASGHSCDYYYQINEVVCGRNCQYFYQTNEVRCTETSPFRLLDANSPNNVTPRMQATR